MEPAYTIHRFSGSDFNEEFYKNENNCFSQSIYIIDEAFMLSPKVFEKFLSAIPQNSKIILAGDDKQIKSYGLTKGETLSDILKNNKFVDITTLNQNHRSNNKVLSTIKEFEDIQFFMTSHSYDTVKSLYETAEEFDFMDDVNICRVESADVKSRIEYFNEDDLKYFLDNELELR